MHWLPIDGFFERWAGVHSRNKRFFVNKADRLASPAWFHKEGANDLVPKSQVIVFTDSVTGLIWIKGQYFDHNLLIFLGVGILCQIDFLLREGTVNDGT